MPLRARETARLATNLEALQQLFVGLEIMPFDIIEKFASAAGHRDEAAAAMKVLAVGTEVIGEVGDALGEQGDLYLGRAGIRVVRFEVGDDRRFIQLRVSHCMM